VEVKREEIILESERKEGERKSWFLATQDSSSEDCVGELM